MKNRNIDFLILAILSAVFLSGYFFYLGSFYANKKSAKAAAAEKSGVYLVKRRFTDNDKTVYELEMLTSAGQPTNKHYSFQYCDPIRMLREGTIVNLVSHESVIDSSASSTEADCYLSVVAYK